MNAAKGQLMKIQSISLKLTAVIALLIGMLNFSGCHTVKGAGQDIEKAGEGIQNSADKHS
jgi:predicted small secreted protein